MIRVVPVLALLALAAACAPDQPPVTGPCASVADCPLGEVCDQTQGGACIAEPEDRFTGAFHCVIGQPASAGLEPSEVIGRIAGDRWSLPEVFCIVSPNAAVILLGFSDAVTGNHLTVMVDAEAAKSGRVTLGPTFEAGLNAASMENDDTFTAYGYSGQGSVTFSPAATPGAAVAGYLDVTMVPVGKADALFGAPCPNGRADCGKKTFDAGGVKSCRTLLTVPMCTSLCQASGDCSVGDGACVNGFCTKACTTDADCGPLRCVAGDPGEGSGCF